MDSMKRKTIDSTSTAIASLVAGITVSMMPELLISNTET